MESFTFIDLFAGIGGFHHALKSIGGQCVMTCEIDKECGKIYRNSFPDAGTNYKFIENIRNITRFNSEEESSLRTRKEIDDLVPDHDVLCGGFPCQPFSKSGSQHGVRDQTRGTLFYDILQIVEAKRPKYIFLENVRNLAGPRHKDTWSTVISSIRSLEYSVSEGPLIFSPHLLDPSLGGAPQVRERVFIVCVRKDVDEGNVQRICEFNNYLRLGAFYKIDDWDVRKYISDDIDVPDLEKYSVTNDEATYLEAWDYFVREFPGDTLPGFPIWAFAFTECPQIDDEMPEWKRSFLRKNSDFYSQNKDFLDRFLTLEWGMKKLNVLQFPYSRQILEWQAKKKHPTSKTRTLRDLVIQFRPSGIRVKPPSYLPALVAITQTSVLGPLLRKGARTYRKLTPVEAARLQGIPDWIYQSEWVSDKAAYKQLGNAVNVGIVRYAFGVFLGHMDFPTKPTKSETLQLFAD
jgi:DNA (cytosine-5)-methyltransferase 1